MLSGGLVPWDAKTVTCVGVQVLVKTAVAVPGSVVAVSVGVEVAELVVVLVGVQVGVLV